MKNLLPLLLAITFFGCGKKSPEPEPTDLAEQVAGKYLVYETVVDTKVEAVDPKQPESTVEIVIEGENKISFKLTNIDRKLYTELFYSNFYLRMKGTSIQFNFLSGNDELIDMGLYYNQVLQLNDNRGKMVRAKRI